MSMTGAILVLAWSLGSVTKSMGLGDFVATYVGESIPTGLLPLLVLVCSCLVAFATGTSWGTMAIMTPLAIQLGYAILHRYDWCSCFRRYLRRSLLTCIRYHRYGLHLLRC